MKKHEEEPLAEAGQPPENVVPFVAPDPATDLNVAIPIPPALLADLLRADAQAAKFLERKQGLLEGFRHALKIPARATVTFDLDAGTFAVAASA